MFKTTAKNANLAQVKNVKAQVKTVLAANNVTHKSTYVAYNKKATRIKLYKLSNNNAVNAILQQIQQIQNVTKAQIVQSSSSNYNTHLASKIYSINIYVKNM